MLRKAVVFAMLLAASCPAPLHAQVPVTSPAWDRYEKEKQPTPTPVPAARPLSPGERTAHAGLSRLFAGDRRGLARLQQDALGAEQAGGPAGPLPMNEALLYLFNASLTDREQFLVGMEVAARETANEDQRTRCMLMLLTDEYYELNQLKGQNRFNKFTRVFNRASSSLSKLAMFQPQDAAQLLLDAAYSMKKAKKTTDRERQMVFLGRAFLAEHPDAPEAAEVRALMEDLRVRLDADWALRDKAAGKLALERGNPEAAEFHLETASLLAPNDAETSRLLAQARNGRRMREELLSVALAVSPAETRYTAAENDALARCARALAAGNAEALVRSATGVGRLADSGEYALAALDERRGNHEVALARLRNLAATMPDSAGGLAAGGLLANHGYNLDEGFDSAVTRMKERQRKFIMTGSRDTDDMAYAVGSASIQSAGSSAAGVPALFLTDVMVRGVAERFRTQVQVDEVVDAGARYMRRYPDSPRTPVIAASLADLTMKSGDYTRSQDYTRQSGNNDPRRESKLRENQARKMLEEALAERNLAMKRSQLDKLLREYGDTRISEKARAEVAKIPPSVAGRTIVLGRKALAGDPDFVRKIGMDPALVDGRKSNGEVADQGIALDLETRRYSYKLKGGDEFQEGRLPGGGTDALVAQAVALWKSSEFRESGRDTLRRQVVPLAIEGGAGGSGVEVSPKLIPYRGSERDEKYFR